MSPHARSVLAALLLAGCSGGSPSAADGGLDASTSDGAARDGAAFDTSGAWGDLARDYCAPLAAFVCESAGDCGCGAIVPGGALDVGACTARWTVRCQEAWQPFVSAGARIDATAAAACVAATRAGTPACASPDGTVPFAVCAPFAVDPSTLGGTCATPYCAGGAGRCVRGTCRPAVGEGGACSDLFACATGLACSGGACRALAARDTACAQDLDCAPPLRCVASACEVLGAPGAPCTTDDACAYGLACTAGACATPSATACDDGASCGHGAQCGGRRVCAARSSAGAGCADDRDCTADLYCDDARTCAPRPAIDQLCARGVICAAGLACDGDGGHCAPLPTAGAPCGFGELGPSACAAGLGCVGGTCASLPTEGMPCTLDNRCAEGLGCDFSPAGSLCIVPRGAGGRCESDRSCAAALHCGPSGTCEADLPSGSPCSVGNECAGVCGPSASGGLSCRDAPTAGEPCIAREDCPLTDTCRAPALACVAAVCTAI